MYVTGSRVFPQVIHVQQPQLRRLPSANINHHNYTSHCQYVQRTQGTFQGSTSCLSVPRIITSSLANANQAGVKDVITLFHAPNSPASIRVHTLLKQTAGAAHSTATIDQASSHPQQSKVGRTDFELGTYPPQATV
jgi:hypothetical protein